MSLKVDNAALTGWKSIRFESRAVQRLLACLVLLPPFMIALSISKYGVDVIDWDQWEIAAFFAKAANHTLAIGDLFAPQVEHRQFFPNAIFLGLGWLTHWNIKAEMFFSLLLACLVALNIHGLSRMTVGAPRSKQLLLTLIGNLLIFAPAQFENWLLGEQINYFLPIACMTTALRVALSALNPNAKLIWCGLLSTISTFSSGNGIVCWIVVAPVLFYREQRAWRIVFWLTAFIGNMAMYLSDLHKPSYTPSVWEALQHPVDALVFFCALLGAPLLATRRLILVPAALGALLASLFLALCFYIWRIARDSRLTRDLICWSMLGAFSMITAIIVTIVRLGFGVGQSVISRYETFTVYLPVSLCFVAPIIAADLQTHRRLPRLTVLFPRLLPFALALVILLHVVNSFAAVRQMAAMKVTRLQAKACLLFVNAVPDECLNKGFPDFPQVSERINAMNALGYLRPRLIDSNSVDGIAVPTVTDPARYGRFENLGKTDAGALFASGWASLPERGAPADAVLLTYQTDRDAPIIFALADMTIDPPSFFAPFITPDPLAWRWHKSIARNRAPVPAQARIHAWAFDSTTGKAYQLNGEFLVENDAVALAFKETNGPR